MKISMTWDPLIRNGLNSIFITDKDARIIEINEQAAADLDLPVSDMAGSTVYDLVGQGIYRNSTMLRAMQRKQVVTDIITTHSGRQFLATSIPVINTEGEVDYVITTSCASELLDQLTKRLISIDQSNQTYRAALSFLNDNSDNTMIAESERIREVIEYCNSIADFDGNVIIEGESGSGKEIISRYLHKVSNRRSQAFIPVNCAAIPKDLFESEFFGYVSGAFTGAATKGKAGFFELADKGTLFLDEIGELPLGMQSKLMRAVETGEISPVGSNKMIKKDVRIISATNRDLLQMTKDGLFRSDFYYRLSVAPIFVPPLRERREDILALANYFLECLNRKRQTSKYLLAESQKTLLQYDWPGNIRELRNVVERAHVISRQDGIRITTSELTHGRGYEHEVVEPLPETAPQTECFYGTLKQALGQFEASYIESVVRKNGFRISAAATDLGINRSTLYRKLKMADIDGND